MTDKEKQMLVQLREFTRQEYEGLDGKTSPLAMTKVSDAAWTLSSIVKSLDEVLKDYVTFQKS